MTALTVSGPYRLLPSLLLLFSFFLLIFHFYQNLDPYKVRLTTTEAKFSSFFLGSTNGYVFSLALSCPLPLPRFFLSLTLSLALFFLSCSVVIFDSLNPILSGATCLFSLALTLICSFPIWILIRIQGSTPPFHDFSVVVFLFLLFYTSSQDSLPLLFFQSFQISTWCHIPRTWWMSMRSSSGEWTRHGIVLRLPNLILGFYLGEKCRGNFLYSPLLWNFSVVVDNETCKNVTVVQLDSVHQPGILLEVVQVLADLNLIITKAYISSDGGWFMDGNWPFHLYFV